MNINFYSRDPQVNELVLIIITENTNDFFKANLCYYHDYAGLLTYQDVTKKKKIYNWKKFITFNKPIIGQIYEIDKDKKTIRLNLCNIDTTAKWYTYAQTYFSENKLLENCITSFAIKYKQNFDELWTHVVYPISKFKYNEDQDKYLSIESIIEGSYISLWKYMSVHIEKFKSWLSNIEYPDDLVTELYNHIVSKITNTNRSINSTFVLMSCGDIQIIKDILKSIIIDNKLNIIIKYISASTYLIESNTCNSNVEDHTLYIDSLQKIIKDMKINIIINSVGKLI